MTNDVSAFGELLVAQITPVTGWKFAFGVNADMVKATTVGSGTVVGANGMAVLSTGAAANSSAKIETILPIRYVPGMGGLARFTAIFSDGVAGCTQLIGVGNASNGFFFGYNGTTFGVLRRRDGVDNWTPLTSWSGYLTNQSSLYGELDNIDPTKGNVYQISYQWLGFGPPIFYIEDPETHRFAMVHAEEYANANTETTILDPTLPIMAMVENTTNATNVVLRTPSALGAIEGYIETLARINPFSLSREQDHSKTGVSTETNIMTLKNQASWQSLTNSIHAHIKQVAIAVDGTKSAIFHMTKGATLGGTPSYTDWNADTSPIQYDVAGTTITGGTEVFSTVLAKSDSQVIDVSTLGIAVLPGETLSFTVRSAASTDVELSVIWEDLH